MAAPFKLYGLILATFCLLQGCVSAILVGTATVAATKATTDPRTLGRQIDDSVLKGRILVALRSNNPLHQQTKYQISVSNGMVLLTGQAPTAQLSQQIEQITTNIAGVTEIHNAIRITQPINASVISKDIWITTKIRSLLLTNRDVKFNHVKLITEDGEVFLYGLVTHEEAEMAVSIARHTKGVKKVIKLFKYIQEDK